MHFVVVTSYCKYWIDLSLSLSFSLGILKLLLSENFVLSSLLARIHRFFFFRRLHLNFPSELSDALGAKFPFTSRDCKQYNNGRSYYKLVQWEFRENFADLPFLSILISNANETSRNNERRSSIELSAVACINVCHCCCSDFAKLSASDEGIVLVFALLKLTRN